MARPRKDAREACARERLVDAYWELLEGRAVSDITVGAVVERARCNRGTFYYYFSDMDALSTEAVRRELEADEALAPLAFAGYAAGDAEAIFRHFPGKHIRRVRLMVRAGKFPVFERAVRSAVQRSWESSVCREGESLAPAARFAIQYMVGGMLGFAVWASQSGEPLRRLPREERLYLADIARVTVEAVARAQGMDPGELLERIGRPRPPRAR